MIKPAQYRRLAMMALLLVIALAGLGYRLVSLQVGRHEELTLEATALRRQKVLRASERGDIIDANGHRLATTVLVKTIVADPKLIGTNQLIVARALAPVLKMNEAELLEKLQIRTYKSSDGMEHIRRSVILKRQVPFEDWDRVRAVMATLNFGATPRKLSPTEKIFYDTLRRFAVQVEATDEQMRVYPNGPLAAHVVGYVGSDDKKVDGLATTELKGRDGIEARYDPILKGVVGWKQTEMDVKREELAIYRVEDVSSRPGLNVVLTLDAAVQSIVETELAAAAERHSPLSASAVVVRPRTGAIVAMATWPGFDPNHPGANTPIASLRNRIITDSFEPGSTFKAVVLSGALNERVVTLNDRFFCENGAFRFANHVLHDAGHRFGDLSVEEIIAHSSNIGAAKVGLKMGEGLLYDYIRRFGFGDRSGIPLQGEVGGVVHDIKDWSKISVVQIPMGQGIAVTPIQMAMAISAIANGGLLMRPMLVDRFEDDRETVVKKFQPEPVRQVISASTAKLMSQAMKRAVSTNGTGVKARLDHYTAAGKTGTGQKPPYGSDKYFASFIGFLPADRPELCIAVFIDQPDKKNGYYGGDTAAPVFKRIAERAAVQLGIRPDKEIFDDPAPASSDTYTDATQLPPLTPAQTRGNF